MSAGSHEGVGGYQRLRDYNELEHEALHGSHAAAANASAASSPGRTSVPGLLGIPPVRPLAAPSLTSSTLSTAVAGGGRTHHGGKAFRQKKGR